MKKIKLLFRLISYFLFIVLIISMIFSNCEKSNQTSLQNSQIKSAIPRIISMAPNITEMLFYLDLGQYVVAVSNFCQYPPQVESLPKIGSYLSPNLEMILSLSPTDIIVLQPQKDIKDMMEPIGIHVIVLKAERTTDILDSLIILGQSFDKKSLALSKVQATKDEMTQISMKYQSPKKASVMLVYGRTPGQLTDIYIAGGKSFVGDIARTVGIKNVFEDSPLAFPLISVEEILFRNPDIIIEIQPGAPEDRLSEIQQSWRKLEHLSAVKNNRIYLLSDKLLTIPGPRFPQIGKLLLNIVSKESSD